MAGSSEADRQLPLWQEIFLDHLAHFVRDAQAAGRALARAGFAPAPLSIQSHPDPDGGPPRPTGTGNITVMFRRGYVEVLFKTSDTPLAGELDAALEITGLPAQAARLTGGGGSAKEPAFQPLAL